MPFFRYGIDPFRIEHVITIDESACLFFRHVVDGAEGELLEFFSGNMGKDGRFSTVDGQGNGRFYKSHNTLLIMNLSGFVFLLF